MSFKITVLENGPIIITNSDNEKIALCRCGESSNKPFCDGAHQPANFESPGVEFEVEDEQPNLRCSC